jgi:hypothetical protein
MSLTRCTAVLCVLCCLVAVASAQPIPPDTGRAWIARSDHYAQSFTDLVTKYNPESASWEGLVQYDTLISVPTVANDIAQREDMAALVVRYTDALSTEKNPRVGEDLAILIDKLNLLLRWLDLAINLKITFPNAASEIYNGIEILLGDQTAVERHAAAVERLRKYAGLSVGYRPITAIWRNRLEKEMAQKSMIYPSKKEIELGVSRSGIMMNGIADLFKKYQLQDWEQPYELLKKQVADFNKWMQDTLLPLARADFRLPAEEYALMLDFYGIEIPPADLVSMGHAAFTEIQNEMKPLAAQIAAVHRFPSGDYRNVIRELKKQQLHGDTILIVFKRNLSAIETIIREHHLVTLPDRPVTIRLATAAETVENPNPQLVPPPLLNNKGEHGVFLIPLNMPPAPGDSTAKNSTTTPMKRLPGRISRMKPDRDMNCNLTKWWKRAFRTPASFMPSIPPMSRAGHCTRNILCCLICRRKANCFRWTSGY